VGRHRRYDEVLGRLASQDREDPPRQEQAQLHAPRGLRDYVIVINAEKVKLTGNKMTDKVYTRHTDIRAATSFPPTPPDRLSYGQTEPYFLYVRNER